ncbi:HTH-type transcriptional regulator IscR [Anaerohalosphaera lusitana]|uniref:HTH-type transcriptional regulator IscR n=1 Tax=Anaerohalosphaera lusitana TaxID=1936003 RepID=A0A1U9NK56_9BACT|nr:Rrf2 family transcriptional regulator [Anaerohalosphaera lusitana]AQT67896.1 HTH-type transcriptional regulator IscR [Anaerohalosphaera lusitana]
MAFELENFGRLPKKSEYALRSLYELAARAKAGPVKVRSIAESQKLPVRFLEVILAQLRQGGFVESRRGSGGGYLLARNANDISVGEVLQFMQGGAAVEVGPDKDVPGQAAFSDLWREAHDAVANVFEGTSLGDLVRNEEKRRSEYVGNYVI